MLLLLIQDEQKGQKDKIETRRPDGQHSNSTHRYWTCLVVY